MNDDASGEAGRETESRDVTAPRAVTDGASATATNASVRNDAGANGAGAKPAAVPAKARAPRELRIVEDGWATFRHVVESVAIIAAGAWAFYTFVYQEKIKPASEPAAIGASLSFARLGRDAKRDIVSVTVTIHNPGHAEIDLVAGALNVWGIRYGKRERIATEDSPGKQSFERQMPVLANDLVLGFAQLGDRAVGGRRGVHFIIEPGDTQTISEVVIVPRGAYDVLHGEVLWVPIKTSRPDRVAISMSRTHDGGFFLQIHDREAYFDNSYADFSLIP